LLILLVKLSGLDSFIVASFATYTEGAAVLFPRRAAGAGLSRKDYGLSLRFYPEERAGGSSNWMCIWPNRLEGSRF
jgi:hypothetical protein